MAGPGTHWMYAKRIPVGLQGADDEEEEEEGSTVPPAPLAQAKPPVNIITSSSGIKPCRSQRCMAWNRSSQHQQGWYLGCCCSQRYDVVVVVVDLPVLGIIASAAEQSEGFFSQQYKYGRLSCCQYPSTRPSLRRPPSAILRLLTTRTDRPTGGLTPSAPPSPHIANSIPER